jgi:hypothetical protein
MLPTFVAPLVVDHDETAVGEVLAQGLFFICAEQDISQIAHEGERVLEQAFVGDLDVETTRVHFDRRQFVKATCEIEIRFGPISETSVAIVAQSQESEMIGRELGIRRKFLAVLTDQFLAAPSVTSPATATSAWIKWILGREQGRSESHQGKNEMRLSSKADQRAIHHDVKKNVAGISKRETPNKPGHRKGRQN